MEARNVVPVIPMRRSRRLRVAEDRTRNRLRNLVERCFRKPKNAGRIATLCDKTAESFPGFIEVSSIRLWIHHLPACPSDGAAAGDGAASSLLPVQQALTLSR